jgi:hypothetical protein
MQSSGPLPVELESVRANALLALHVVKPVQPTTQVAPRFFATAQRTDAGRRLPDYYLVYLLMVELFGFPHEFPEEKVAWVVPLDYRGELFTIEHRKTGLGLFVPEPDAHAAAAQEIVNRVSKATQEAQPFFDWLADEQVAVSAVNFVKRSQLLFERYRFLHASAIEQIAIQAAKFRAAYRD